MEIVIIALVFVFLALIVVGIAIGFTMKKRKLGKSVTELTEKATVLNTYDEVYSESSSLTGTGTVGSFNAYEGKKYYIEFRLEDGSIKKFRVNKKLFLNLSQGMTGMLTYKGDKLINYANDNTPSIPQNNSKYFFLNDTKSGSTVKFYASAPSLGIEIPSDREIDCDYNEICNYIDNMLENNTDNFFVITDKYGRTIQFFNDGQTSMIEVDIPIAHKNGSYQGELSTLQEAKSYLRTFLDNMDMPSHYNLTFNEW